MVEAFIVLLFPAGMILAGALDFFTMTISNRIALALLGGFFALAIILGLPLAEIGQHISAGAAMLVIAFLMFCAGWIGGGDAKLFAVTALWLGWTHLMQYAFLVAIFGGVLTFALILARQVPLPSVFVKQSWAVRLHEPRGDIPYGIALAAAGLAIYPQTLWMAAIG